MYFVFLKPHFVSPIISQTKVFKTTLRIANGESHICIFKITYLLLVKCLCFFIQAWETFWVAQGCFRYSHTVGSVNLFLAYTNSLIVIS